MAGIEIDIKSTDHQQLYKHGVRAYVLQDYDSAVRAFSRCLELLTSEYNDDQHDSLGDVYLYYGKSLLGLSRQELEPLNENVIKNNEENDDEDDDNDGQDEDSGGGGGDGDAKQDKPAEENGTAVVNGDDNKPETNSNKDDEDDDDNDKPAEEKEDELTDLQVAWEVLELAKKIFSKRAGDGGEGSDNLAETLIVLGEISLESGNFQIGIDDIRKGLEIQEQLYKNDSRTLAETYYKLGTALSTNQQIDAAIEQYQKSLESLQLRLDNLKKAATTTDDVKDEIEEIEDLMPEIEEKITDMKSYKLEMLKKEETSADKPQSSSSSTSTSSSKQATDISHLVKRKRPAEDGASCSGGGDDHVPAKKPSL